MTTQSPRAAGAVNAEQMGEKYSFPSGPQQSLGSSPSVLLNFGLAKSHLGLQAELESDCLPDLPTDPATQKNADQRRHQIVGFTQCDADSPSDEHSENGIHQAQAASPAIQPCGVLVDNAAVVFEHQTSSKDGGELEPPRGRSDTGRAQQQGPIAGTAEETAQEHLCNALQLLAFVRLSLHPIEQNVAEDLSAAERRIQAALCMLGLPKGIEAKE